MSRESDFLLGLSFGALMKCRQYLIEKDDSVGVQLIEDDYQHIASGIERVFYQKGVEKNGK